MRAKTRRLESTTTGDESAELAQLYRTAPVGLCLVDRELRFVRVNEHMAERNGASVEAHLGRTLRDVIPDLAEKIEPVFRSVIETGEPVIDVELREAIPADPGSERWSLARFDPVRGVDGSVVGVSSVVQDITERKRMEETLRESEALHHALSEASAVGLYRATEAEGCIYANRRFCEMAGVEAEELMGAGWARLIHPDDRDAVMAARERCYREHLPYLIEIRVCRRDRRVVWVLAHSLPEWDNEGRFVGMVGCLTDITERKLAEEELARHRDDLEELVQQRTRDLEASHRKLLQSERLASLGTVAAGLAHQLNNPLGGILLAAQHALDSGSDPATVHASLEDILSDARRCRRIVRSVLRFTGRRRSALSLEDLNEVVRIAAKTIAGSAAIVLDLSPLPPIPLDRVAIEEVICNLVRNALEAGAENVVLRTGISGNGDSVLLTVEDDGAGIAPEHLSRIFDPFFSTRQTEGGTGLGLAVAQRVASQHGGSLDAKRGPRGRGTEMTIELPLDPRAASGDSA